MLLSLGILSKHRNDRMAAFTTTFDAFMFGIANKESHTTYKLFFEAAVKAVQQLCGVDLRDACQQYHGDWHRGEELARQEVLCKSQRCGDWSHFTGATVQRKKLQPMLPATRPGEKLVNAWRVGVYATIRKRCSSGVRADETVEFLKPIFEVSRVAPTLLLFHTIWHHAFQALNSRGEAACASALERCYFFKVAASEARSVWGMESWHGTEQWVHCAAWWSGCQRLQPGSASGTQAQESWHRHVLKAYMGSLRLTMPEFIDRLSEFCEARLAQQHANHRKFVDYPAEPWPDPVLLDTEKLARQRRTSAHEFVTAGLHSEWLSPNGTRYFAMRQHTFAWCTASKTWVKDNTTAAVRSDLAESLACVYHAHTKCELDDALAAAGVTLPIAADLKSLVKFLDEHVLVMFGPIS